MTLDEFLFLDMQFLAVPSYFMIYSTVRYIYHWHDGKEPTISSYSRIHFTKRILTLLMLVISLYLATLHQHHDWNSSEAAMRKVCYACYSIAWTASYALIIFEERRRLQIQWWGHRLFWFMSSVNNLTMGIVHLTFIHDTDECSTQELVISNILNFLSTISCCILTALGCINPELQIKINEEEILNEIINIHIGNLEENKENGPETLPVLKTSIQDVKVKQLNDKKILFYNIQVKLSSKLYTVRRSFLEFSSLHSYLRTKFDFHKFPCLNFPAFPRFNTCDDISWRISALSKYLNTICKPEFMSEELLDFLDIEEKSREIFLRENRKILELNCVSFLSPRALPDLLEVPKLRSRNPSQADDFDKAELNLQRYITVRIDRWYKTNYPDTHVEYTITWSASKLFQKGLVQKRYSDIYGLHCSLKKILHPVNLPEFPSKNYLETFRKTYNEEMLNCRKNQLERYLSHVLNEPAYHCEELFKFLGLNATPQDLWEASEIKYSYAIKRMKWDSEVSELGKAFHIYSIEIERIGLDSVIWQFRHRFSEFVALHKELASRSQSPVLEIYMDYLQKKGLLYNPSLPGLPSRTFAEVKKYEDLSRRCMSLEIYLSALLNNECTISSYEFRRFIEDPM
jgi:hypothetical protein